jgi:hypothetical protein
MKYPVILATVLAALVLGRLVQAEEPELVKQLD